MTFEEQHGIKPMIDSAIEPESKSIEVPVYSLPEVSNEAFHRMIDLPDKISTAP
jgi:hypothetical protein